jgi:hypothetical protein
VGDGSANGRGECVGAARATQEPALGRLFCVAFPSLLFFVALLAGCGKHVDMIHIDFPD